MASGRFDEAVREIEQARELEPLSLIINANHGRAFFYKFDPILGSETSWPASVCRKA